MPGKVKYVLVGDPNVLDRLALEFIGLLPPRRALGARKPNADEQAGDSGDDQAHNFGDGQEAVG